LNDEGFVTKTAEKEVISSNALTGFIILQTQLSFLKPLNQRLQKTKLSKENSTLHLFTIILSQKPSADC
jgi:hypothetical protein